MTTLILIRHGETYYNVVPERHVDGLGRDIPPDCYRATTDADIIRLNPRGRRQAECLAVALKSYPIDVCYRSPALRVGETVEPYLAWRKQEDGKALPCHIRDGLEEHSSGDLSALGTERDPRPAWSAAGRDEFDLRWPGGETVSELLQRIRPVVKEILKKAKGKTVLVGGHCGMNAAFINILNRTDASAAWCHDFVYQQPNACINELICDDKGLTGDPMAEGRIGIHTHIPPELKLRDRS